jgi:hypothetical protein
VNPNWNETDTAKPEYIQNKPQFLSRWWEDPNSADSIYYQPTAGRVGIGKSPASGYKLDVNGQIRGTILTSTTEDVAPFQVSSLVRVDNLNASLLDGLGKGAFMRTDEDTNTTGNVGIGTTSSASYKLDVNGQVRATIFTSTTEDVAPFQVSSLVRVDNLNASLLDGHDAGKFMRTDENTSTTGTLTGTRLISTIATGTAPLTITSTTKVANLNADLLDGLDSTKFMRTDADSSSTGIMTAKYFTSTVTTAGPPLVVASTVKVVNLNADLLDGLDSTAFMRADGATNTTGTLTTTRLISTVATGTSPLAVTSTTLVTNLNAELLNGQNAAYYLNYANLTGVPAVTPSQWVTNGTNIYYNAGNVGIGTLTPANKFVVYGTTRLGGDTNGNIQTTNYGRFQNLMDEISPDQSLTQLFNRVQTTAVLPTANRTWYNTYNQFNNDAIGSTTSGQQMNIFGTRNEIHNARTDNGLGHINTAYGNYNYIINYAGATEPNVVAAAYGTYNYIYQYRGGATTNAYGTYNYMRQAAGTMTNSYGVYVNTGGTITNSFGVYCTGEQKNYFAGNVGIGISAPAAKLHVVGAILATAEITSTGATVNGSTRTTDLHVTGVIGDPILQTGPYVAFNGTTTNRDAFLAWMQYVISPNYRLQSLPFPTAWWCTTLGTAKHRLPITFSTITGLPGVARYCGGVLVPDGRVVLVPYDSTTVGIITPETNQYSTFAIGVSGVNRFVGGVLLPNGDVMFIPHANLNIWFFRPSTNTSFAIGTMSPATGSTNAFSGGVLRNDGTVILIPYSSANTGIYNTNTGVYSAITRPDAVAGAYRGGVLLPDGRVLFVPYRSLKITIMNTNNTYTLITMSPVPAVTSGAYHCGILVADGRVILVPMTSTTIGIFDPATNTYSTIALTGTTGAQKYAGGVLLPDGRVAFFPHIYSFIGIFDPVTNEYSTISGTFTSNAYWGGGVLLPDGRALLLPCNATNVGVLNMNATRTPPHELCLHPAFNKF